MIHKITRHDMTIKVRSHCLITVIDDHTKPITVVKLGMGDLQCILLDSFFDCPYWIHFGLTSGHNNLQLA